MVFSSSYISPWFHGWTYKWENVGSQHGKVLESQPPEKTHASQSQQYSSSWIPCQHTPQSSAALSWSTCHSWVLMGVVLKAGGGKETISDCRWVYRYRWHSIMTVSWQNFIQSWQNIRKYVGFTWSKKTQLHGWITWNSTPPGWSLRRNLNESTHLLLVLRVECAGAKFLYQITSIAAAKPWRTSPGWNQHFLTSAVVGFTSFIIFFW